ncbi:type II toxin-antitoxin system HicB family antitoxin [Azorhizobium sp. AG788]|uniref:type II toxin-antitoxin system HicB family antitoxin n=1 Tax=Azorhizobium sp. AG788 TaxID=2183897 RepID=UPI00106061B1|nr:type II toxin-antitoxin system HicB family antitoxin [Azorhizobium sp. AG788]
MTHYAALIDKAADGSFGVTFPDAPGCTSTGATLEEAAANAVEALRDWIEVLEGKGTPLAAPRSLDAITADPEVKADLSAGAILVAVPVVARRGRTVRVQVTMDEGTLAAIDAAAARSGETRSGFLARSALDAIMRP